MIRTEGTYRKLDKVFTGTLEGCKEILDAVMPFPRSEVKKCTRGDNLIAYFRPDGGKTVNDKIWMMHWNKDGSVSLYF